MNDAPVPGSTAPGNVQAEPKTLVENHTLTPTGTTKNLRTVKDPNAESIVEHANWLLETMNGWVVDGWKAEVKGRLTELRNLAARLAI